MHIQEGTNTTLTTCTKMTEEVDRRHGVNGNSSSKAVSEDPPVNNSALNATGGRLKFFKDGKFILELVRGCAREGGGGGGWVSVPRKTFWPPAAAPPTPPGAPPPACLSVSDDNSSVQSSPWQRDHCWKQAAPRKNLGRELALYYCRPGTLPTAAIEAGSRAKRRRPLDTSLHEARPHPACTNGVADPARNGDASEDAVDGAADRDKYYRIKLKKPYQYRKLRVYRKTRPRLRRKLLARTIDRLAERAPVPAPSLALAAPVNAKLAHCRQEHAIVSPRKRILRELERVTLEEQSGKRRAKTAPALSTASYPPPAAPAPEPGPSHARAPSAPAPKHVSSYSIHSLLSMPDEAPRRSPHSQPPLKTESPCATSPAPSPSPDAYRYRYVGGSPAPGRATPPTPAPCGYRAPFAPAAAYARGAWGAYASRDAPYVYGYGYPAAYRAPPAPLWMHYAPPPSPWAPLALPLLTDHIPKDEPTSDLPLNLSKH